MTTKKVYNSRIADKFVIRFLEGMRQQIKDISETTHRSMNSEIISWIEMMLETHKETGTIPNLDQLRSTAQLEAQNRALRAVMARLLDAGDWFHSCIELDSHDHHVDGEKFEQEIKDILAAKPDYKTPEEPAKKRGPVPKEKLKRFTASVGVPVAFDHNGKYTLGVVTKIWVDTYGGFEKFKARVEMRSAGNAEVWLTDLNEPDHL